MLKYQNKELLLIASAMIGVPLLLLLQQTLLPQGSAPESRPDWERRMETLTDAALSGHNPKGACFAAFGYLQRGDEVSGEAWLKYGARLKRYPSAMVAYGDFCRAKGRTVAARRWYLLALKSAPENDGAFAAAVRERLRLSESGRP